MKTRRDERKRAEAYGSYVARVDRKRARELLAHAVRNRSALTQPEARKLYEDLTRALRHLELYGSDDPRNVQLRRRISSVLTSVRHRAEGRSRSSRDPVRVERGDTIEYLGAAYDDAGKPLRGRTGVVEEFYGRSTASGRHFMMKVRFGSHVHDMSQDAPLRIVKHARRHHRSRYPSGQQKPRFRVGQTVRFRARTHHGSPVSYGRVQSVSGLREHGEQPLYNVKLPNGVSVLAHQGSLTASPRSKASRGRDPRSKRRTR